MARMMYSTYHTVEVLSKGTYSGYNYVIINRGTHPCCYVQLPEDHPWAFHHHDTIPVECHGGLNYSGKSLQLSDNSINTDGWWIGWCYDTPDDYTGRSRNTDLKMWTTDELELECHNVISQID